MESISLKMEKGFLSDIEKIMKKHNYSTKTEFIREAIRDKIKKLEEKETKFVGEIKREVKKEVRAFPSYI
jgi:metal-responsive CopG/Arc/MetJ family transcriptional regulator